jgi:hypothetical protein
MRKVPQTPICINRSIRFVSLSLTKSHLALGKYDSCAADCLIRDTPDSDPSPADQSQKVTSLTRQAERRFQYVCYSVGIIIGQDFQNVRHEQDR